MNDDRSICQFETLDINSVVTRINRQQQHNIARGAQTHLARVWLKSENAPSPTLTLPILSAPQRKASKASSKRFALCFNYCEINRLIILCKFQGERRQGVEGKGGWGRGEVHYGWPRASPYFVLMDWTSCDRVTMLTASKSLGNRGPISGASPPPQPQRHILQNSPARSRCQILIFEMWDSSPKINRIINS